MLRTLLPAAGIRSKFPAGLKNWWKLQTDYEDHEGDKNGVPTGTLSFVTFLGRKALRLILGGGYVTLPSLSFGNAPWTLSLWYSPVDLAQYHHLLTSEDHGALLFKIARSDDPVAGKVYVYAGTFNPAGSKYATDNIPVGTWTLLTFTFDGSTLNIYYNDVLKRSVAVTMNVPTRNFRIGYGNAGEYSKGYQSDVRIFDRALSLEEIRQVMATPQ